MTGGVVFSVEGALFFLPATIASKVLPMPGVSPVPGAPEALVGLALVEGEVVPVVAVGALDRRASRRSNGDRPRADNGPMLVCSYLGERVALVGLEIVATGSFDATDGTDIVHDGRSVRPFDVAAVVGQLRDGRWAV